MSYSQSSADKLRTKLHTVEAEKKELQEKYVEAMKKVSLLETELDKANVQVRLLEDKLRAEQGTLTCENEQTFAMFS
jgi:predicted nuclease with TOPRIM domain